MERHPQLRVTVIDRPEVVGCAASDQRKGQIAHQETDLFSPWDIEGDAVILARVLHDWDDEHALLILRHAHRALPIGGRLFVVEMLLDREGVAGGLCDLHLLMATGGKERTLAEFAALLERAGFACRGARRMPALPSVLVGVAQ